MCARLAIFPEASASEGMCDAVAFVFALLSPPFLLYYKMRHAKIKHSKTLTQHEIMRESMKRCVKQSSL